MIKSASHLDLLLNSIEEMKISNDLCEEKSEEFTSTTRKRLSFLARHSIPFTSSIQSDLIDQAFYDRFSFAINLLLLDKSEVLDQLGLQGNSSFFLSGFVIFNYLNSNLLNSLIEELSIEEFNVVQKSIQKYKLLMESFKTSASSIEILTHKTGGNFKIALGNLTKKVSSIFNDKKEMLIPLGWRKWAEGGGESCHLFLVYIDCNRKHYHIINTFPCDKQNYMKISQKKFKQDVSLSFKFDKVEDVFKKIIDSCEFFNPTLNLEKESEDILSESISILSQNASEIPVKESPFDRINLHFGYGCAVEPFFSLMQILLRESFEKNCSSVSCDKLFKYLDLWCLGLKVYVLENFYLDINKVGEELFEKLHDELIQEAKLRDSKLLLARLDEIKSLRLI